MKKFLPLTLFVLLVLVWACRKELTRPETEGSPASFSIKQAREHYQQLLGSTSKTASLSAAGKNKLLWSRAYLARQKTTDFVEVPVMAREKKVVFYNFPKDSVKYAPDESVANFALQRVIFFSHASGVVKERIITYIPDKEYLIKNRTAMGRNSIKKMQSNFKGYIEYRNWDGKVLSVARVVKGKVVRVYLIGKGRAAKKGGKKASVSEWVCTEECYEETTWTCGMSDPDGEGGYNNVYCHDFNTEYWCEETCSYEQDSYDDPSPSGYDNGNSGGGGSGGGGYGSGGNSGNSPKITENLNNPDAEYLQ